MVDQQTSSKVRARDIARDVNDNAGASLVAVVVRSFRRVHNTNMHV